MIRNVDSGAGLLLCLNRPEEKGGTIAMEYWKLLRAAVVVSMFSLAGCAASRLVVNEWTNPAYATSSFKKAIVSCLDAHASIRRSCEDEFVTQLRPEGVEALPSYRYFPEDGKVEEAKIRQAAKEAGADASLIVRAVGVEQKTELSPGFFPAFGFGIFGRNVSASWYPWYGSPRVDRYEVYTSEATLYDETKNQIVWTGTLRTTMPDNMNAAIKRYVQEVVKALNEKNLLGIKH